MIGQAMRGDRLKAPGAIEVHSEFRAKLPVRGALLDREVKTQQPRPIVTLAFDFIEIRLGFGKIHWKAGAPDGD